MYDLEQCPEEAFPTFDQLKVMLARHDTDLAYIESESVRYKEQIALFEEQIINLKNQLNSQQIMLTQNRLFLLKNQLNSRAYSNKRGDSVLGRA